jgi:phosphonate transport system substrate-binding protein
MKRFLPLVLFGLLACGFLPTPQPAATPTSLPTSAPTAPSPDAALGSAKNPLILSLAPSTQPVSSVLQASHVLQAHLEKSTGYKFIIVAPASETEMVKAFLAGNAHIGVFSPYGYLMVSNAQKASAAFGRQRNGNLFYGAQFIVQSDAGFTSYYDPIKDSNMDTAPVALAQFANKKPCWADELSPSGYVVPLGILAEANVKTLEPAFVSGQATVVRAVYAKGVCDFGATYIDARTYPGLADEFPDVLKKVVVVWRIAPIIPYETLVFARPMDVDMRRALERAFVDAMQTSDGASAIQTLYGIDTMQITQDGQYDEFRKAVQAAGLDLTKLVK